IRRVVAPEQNAQVVTVDRGHAGGDDEADVAVVLLGVSSPRGAALAAHGAAHDLPGGRRSFPALEVRAVEHLHAARTGSPLGRRRIGGRAGLAAAHVPAATGAGAAARTGRTIA